MKDSGLRLLDWQYTVRHTSTSCFSLGEIVFFKSNPNLPMIVASINERTIETIWYDVYGELKSMNSPPECILQYRYASFETYKNKLNFCFN